MLISKTAIVKWNSRNKKIYESKGYVFTKMGEDVEVRIEDLTLSSKAKVQVLCDFCKETITEKSYQTYVKQHHAKYGDCCIKCQSLKNKLCCLDKYGVDNGSKVKETKDKIKRVFQQKYNVDNISQLDSVKTILSKKAKANAVTAENTRKTTMLNLYGVTNAMFSEELVKRQQQAIFDKYGVYHPKQNKEIKQQEKEHNIEKYGVPYVLQVPEIRQRIEATCMKKYGTRCCLSNEEIRTKIAQTLVNNGSVPTSSQQLKLHQMLIELYGACELNVPCGRSVLDCVIQVNKIKIDIEYDGAYWHQDKQKDRRRDEYVKSQGYKVLRIISDRTLPTQEQLAEKIDFLISTKYKFTSINLINDR